jgi:hypothetical protein
MVIESFQSPKGVHAYVTILGEKNNPSFRSWATKNFWLPSNGVGVLDGDRNFLIQLTSDNEGMLNVFRKPLPKKVFVVIEKSTFFN